MDTSGPVPLPWQGPKVCLFLQLFEPHSLQYLHRNSRQEEHTWFNIKEKKRLSFELKVYLTPDKKILMVKDNSSSTKVIPFNFFIFIFLLLIKTSSEEAEHYKIYMSMSKGNRSNLCNINNQSQTSILLIHPTYLDVNFLIYALKNNLLPEKFHFQEKLKHKWNIKNGEAKQNKTDSLTKKSV